MSSGSCKRAISSPLGKVGVVYRACRSAVTSRYFQEGGYQREPSLPRFQNVSRFLPKLDPSRAENGKLNSFRGHTKTSANEHEPENNKKKQIPIAVRSTTIAMSSVFAFDSGQERVPVGLTCLSALRLPHKDARVLRACCNRRGRWCLSSSSGMNSSFDGASWHSGLRSTRPWEHQSRETADPTRRERWARARSERTPSGARLTDFAGCEACTHTHKLARLATHRAGYFSECFPFFCFVSLGACGFDLVERMRAGPCQIVTKERMEGCARLTELGV